jgi:1-deoxy-D-xylulose 5-phosphate reductoisomerase
MKVAASMPGRMEIVGMAAYRSAQKLALAANTFRPEALCLVDPTSLNELTSALTYRPKIHTGE